MPTFAQKQHQPLKRASSNLARSNMAPFGLNHHPHPILHLQRTIGNQAVQRMLQTNAEELKAGLTGTTSPRYGHDFSRIPIHPPAAGAIQTKLAINKPGDEYEQEADRVSEQVMRMSEPWLQRTCACGGGCPKCQTEQPDQEHERLQTKRVGSSDLEQTPVPPIVHEVLHSRGQPLDPATRAFMEPRFGHDFSRVRVHTDPLAARSAEAVAAHAYTVGSDVVFGAGRYAPANHDGRRLLAHELTHVVQQNAFPPSAGVVQRQPEQEVDPDVVAEREYGGSGAPKAQTCGRPSWCPAGFCSPYRSEKLAEYYRAKNGGLLMTGISAAVDSRVVPFWQEYLSGGSDPKNITADFGKDFTNSPTTKKTTTFLYDELKKSFAAKPPSVPLYVSTAVDLSTQIPKAIAALDDPASSNPMNFSIPRDIPATSLAASGRTKSPALRAPNPRLSTTSGRRAAQWR
jgi:hypothetical protein